VCYTNNFARFHRSALLAVRVGSSAVLYCWTAGLGILSLRFRRPDLCFIIDRKAVFQFEELDDVDLKPPG